MNADPFLASFARSLWKEQGLLVVDGDIAAVLRGQRAYHSRHAIALPEVELARALERALTGAGLAALSLADRESWGWSMTLPDARFGIFVGAEPEGLLCGTIKAAQREAATVLLQRQKAGEPLTQSHYQPGDTDPLRAIEGHFTAANQIPTRLAMIDSGRCALFQRQPGGTLDQLAGRDDIALLNLVAELRDAGQLKQLEEVLLFYECRCDDDLITGLVSDLPQDRQTELWGDGDRLEIECPRCGRGYTVRRKRKSKPPGV